MCVYVYIYIYIYICVCVCVCVCDVEALMSVKSNFYMNILLCMKKTRGYVRYNEGKYTASD